jgi:hypothetical protein
VDYWQASCAHQPAGFALLVQACVLQSCDANWLPTPFSCFPFTSPPVRHRVPSHFKRSLPPGRFTPSKETQYPMYRRIDGSRGLYGLVWKISPTTGIRSPDHQSVGSRYTDPAFPPAILVCDTHLNEQCTRLHGVITKRTTVLAFTPVKENLVFYNK